MAEYTVAKLSDGREVKVDHEAVKAECRTRGDIKRIAALKNTSDEYDEMLGKMCELSVAELDALSWDDWLAIDTAVGTVIKTFVKTDPNS